MPGSTTDPNIPIIEMEVIKGRERRFINAPATCQPGRGRVSIATHVWGTNMLFRFKCRKN
jgi:hypothetical protein